MIVKDAKSAGLTKIRRPTFSEGEYLDIADDLPLAWLYCADGKTLDAYLKKDLGFSADDWLPYEENVRVRT